MTLMATEKPEQDTDPSAGCRAFLRQMAANVTCSCRGADEVCMAKPTKDGLCQTCAEGCATRRIVRLNVEDEVLHHSSYRRPETAMDHRSPADVRATRQATIDRAINYLTTTDRDIVLAVLAKTRLHDHIQADPDLLLQHLRGDDPEATSFFARWKAAQNVLLAAGLPYA